MAVSTRSSPVTEAPPSFLVALGASAGGLEALSGFFQQAEASAACYVVNQHLSPDHKSALADLLGRRTRLPVTVITDGERLRVGHIHLIPPGSRLTVDHDRLHLTPRTRSDRVNFPIDDFFGSVARHWGARSVAVVLSGTGSDGSEGLRAVAEAGGFALVQTPASAGFDGMPRAALSAVSEAVQGHPDRLAMVIADHLRNSDPLPRPPSVPEQTLTEEAGDIGDETLTAEVLAVLKTHGHGDFSGYKTDTLLTHLHERRDILHVSSSVDYLQHLAHSDSERAHLARQLLIPLTRFFRDAEAFQQLDRQVIDPLVKHWPDDETLRVWCAGVASGEEAYSVSILLQNAFARHQKWPTLKLFATDRDSQRLPFASAGVYSNAIEEEVSEDDLARWFLPVAGGYRVRKAIRQPIVFACHDVVDNPPFTGMDLILCRNVLIYLRPDSQQQALERLHYALNANAVLQLGLTESPDTLAGAFTVLDAEHALYRPNRSVSPRRQRARADTMTRHARASADSPDRRAVESLQKQLLGAFLPPTLIINQSRELVHLLGQTQPLLNFSGGDVSFRLDRLLHPLLRSGVNGLVTDTLACLAQGKPVPAPMPAEGPDNVRYQVQAWSYHPEAGEEHYLALSFATLEPLASVASERLEKQASASTDHQPAGQPADSTPDSLQKDQRIAALEKALHDSEIRRRRAVEALEASNEELHATNEELFTANEELQSTNEELQSLNEELHGVNVEHKESIKELRQMQQDMDTLSQSLGVATLYLDRHLTIQRFTDAMTEFLAVRRGDEGRHLAEFSHHGLYVGLLEDVERCLEKQEFIEFSVPGSEPSDVWVRIMPYRVRQRAEYGVVITVASMSLIRALAQQRPFMNALPGQLLVLDHEGVLLMASDPTSHWSGQADHRLRASLRLGDTRLRDVETELNCRQRWQQAQTTGDVLAEALVDLLPSDRGAVTGTTEVPLGRDGQVLVIHASPVVRGRQRHWLLTLREVGAASAIT